MKERTGWEKARTIMDIILILACIMVVNDLVASAPDVNAYSNYHTPDYQCLEIAKETQEWYNFNGINTTVYIGCFNESLCHAWVETEDGKKIIGYVDEWTYVQVYSLKEWNAMPG